MCKGFVGVLHSISFVSCRMGFLGIVIAMIAGGCAANDNSRGASADSSQEKTCEECLGYAANRGNAISLLNHIQITYPAIQQNNAEPFQSEQERQNVKTFLSDSKDPEKHKEVRDIPQEISVYQQLVGYFETLDLLYDRVAEHGDLHLNSQDKKVLAEKLDRIKKQVLEKNEKAQDAIEGCTIEMKLEDVINSAVNKDNIC